MNSGKTIITIFSFLLIVSCRNKIHWKCLSQDDLESFRKEFNLPKEKTFRLDTNYIRYLFSFDTTKYADQIKNHYQPIQALYYDKSGQLISYHINCYAGINVPDNDDLKWNQGNAFVSFVPKSVVPLDSILPLVRHLSFIKTLEGRPIDTTGFSTFDYTIIIHWGKKLRPKDSKNLIKIVSDNANLAVNKKINILYCE